MLIYEIIDSAIMASGHVAKYPVIYKPWLRFNVYLTMLIAAIVYGIGELAYVSASPVSDNRTVLMLTWLLAEIVNILLVRKDKIIDMLILEYFYQFVYNIIGTGLIAAITIIYSLLSGEGANMQFDRLTATSSDFIIRIISTALCFTISLMLCRKCTVIMANLQRRLKLLLFWGMVVPLSAFMILKNLVVLTAEDMSQGPIVVCYGLLLAWVSVCLLVFFISVFLQTREEARLIQIRTEAQSLHYKRVLKAQQELREAKHELKNRLVAYSMAGHNRNTSEEFSKQ
jgi:hypothetical protein